MKILLLAGEESGLIYAQALRKRLAGAHEIRTYADYGFKTADLAVIGFLPVLKRLGYFLGVRRTMKKALREWRPDVLCTIDYPGMNLALAAYAKKIGIRTVHVVCPQVWAWRSGRIKRIEKSLDKLLCFLPFEPGLFKSGFAEFVGHPLVELYKAMPEYKSIAALEGGMTCVRRHEGQGKLLALMPGSRIGEISEILPTLLEALRSVEGVHAVIPAANAQAREAIDGILAREIPTLPALDSVSVQDGGARELLLRADAAVVASGTATLEAALAGCPTVLVYRVHPFVAWIARHVITGVKHLGLVNIIHGFMHKGKSSEEPPMPELLQEDFNAGAIAGRLREWLSNPESNANARRRLADAVAPLMTDGGVVDRIAAAVLDQGKGIE